MHTLRDATRDAFEAARGRLAELLPSAAVDAAAAALADTLDAAVASASAAAEQLLNSEGGPADAAAAAIEGLTARVRAAEAGFAALAGNATAPGGPLGEAVLSTIAAQVTAA